MKKKGKIMLHPVTMEDVKEGQQILILEYYDGNLTSKNNNRMALGNDCITTVVRVEQQGKHLKVWTTSGWLINGDDDKFYNLIERGLVKAIVLKDDELILPVKHSQWKKIVEDASYGTEMEYHIKIMVDNTLQTLDLPCTFPVAKLIPRIKRSYTRVEMLELAQKAFNSGVKLARNTHYIGEDAWAKWLENENV